MAGPITGRCERRRTPNRSRISLFRSRDKSARRPLSKLRSAPAWLWRVCNNELARDYTRRRQAAASAAARHAPTGGRIAPLGRPGHRRLAATHDGQPEVMIAPADGVALLARVVNSADRTAVSLGHDQRSFARKHEVSFAEATNGAGIPHALCGGRSSGGVDGPGTKRRAWRGIPTLARAGADYPTQSPAAVGPQQQGLSSSFATMIASRAPPKPPPAAAKASRRCGGSDSSAISFSLLCLPDVLSTRLIGSPRCAGADPSGRATCSVTPAPGRYRSGRAFA